MKDVGPGGTDTVNCGERGAAATVAEGATRPEDEEWPTEDPLREPISAEDLLAGVRKLPEPPDGVKTCLGVTSPPPEGGLSVWPTEGRLELRSTVDRLGIKTCWGDKDGDWLRE